MTVANIIISAFVGTIAFSAALLLGAPLWVALGLYILAGSLSLIVAAVVRTTNENLADRTGEDNWNDTELDDFSKQTLDEPAPGAETSMSILVVDDDPLILNLISIISAQVGISKVITAASGREALASIACSDTKFDCLLFDINMPEMNGIELCRLVRRMPQYRSTQIIMLTAMRDMKNIGDAYRAGATDYVTKPFDIYNLGARLRMARETLVGQHGSVTGSKSTSEDRQDLIFSSMFDLRNSGNECVISLTAMSNYLTQLPDKEMANVLIFAVRIDEIESLQTKLAPDQFVSLLQDFAEASEKCLSADRTVMAYTRDATLLIAVNSSVPVRAFKIENNIETQLREMSPEYAQLGVSVGGPTQLRGSRGERARAVTDHVITLAQNREFDKRNQAVAGLTRC